MRRPQKHIAPFVRQRIHVVLLFRPVFEIVRPVQRVCTDFRQRILRGESGEDL